MVGKLRNILQAVSTQRKGKFAIWVIVASLLIGLLSFFIANERPHIATKQGSVYFPIMHEIGEQVGLCNPYPFTQGKDWHDIHFDFKLSAPIPFSPSKINQKSLPYLPPLTFNQQVQKRHWLGTDGMGRDVAAIMIHGYRYALWVGFFSLLIAGLFGVMAGACMGYYGDNRIRIGFLPLGFFILAIGLILFYAVYAQLFASMAGIFILFILVLSLVYSTIFSSKIFSKPSTLFGFPLDLLLMRVIEMFRAIPNIFILLAMMSLITKPNIWNVILIIGFLKWPAIARLMRGEVLNIINKEYILAAKTYGQRDLIILLRHAIPNAISPVIIALAFGISSAILLEATISFLGIGVNPEQMTWGNLLSSARGNFNAWWLAIFPGIALFTLLLALNYVGECLSDILNPKRLVSLS